MKRILLIFVISVWFGAVGAQEQKQEQTRIGPSKGTVTASLILGNTSTYANSGWLQLPAVNGTSSTYMISSPYIYNYPTSNSLVNMIGVEGKWFFCDKWAVRLMGAARLDATPAYEGTAGVPASDPISAIPTYADVPARGSTEVIINAGVDKYFTTKNEHLFWYVSPVATFQYGRKSGFEVTGVDATADPGTSRYAEGFGIGLSGVVGAEYYTTSGIIFGFELRGVSYMYTLNSILPAEGLKPLRSDNHNISFLSQPTLKIGFRF